MENGVFSSRNGFESKCLEIWVRRELARVVRDAMRGSRRLIAELGNMRSSAGTWSGYGIGMPTVAGAKIQSLKK